MSKTGCLRHSEEVRKRGGGDANRVRVWCLRHAEAENVTAGVAGAVPAAPLTGHGHRQANAAARALAGESLAKVYSSTAVRALHTAELLAAASALDVVAMPELVEVGIGEQEGTSDPAVRRRTAEVLRAWVVEEDLGLRVADGESGRQVIGRMTGAFQEISANHPGDTVAVVGHVASLTVALARLCALGAQVWGTPLPHARPFVIEWDGQAWHCPMWPSD